MTTDYEPNVVLSSTEYDVIGTRPVRHDGHDKVTGRAVYGIDYNAAGLLHGKSSRAKCPHLSTRRLDATSTPVAPRRWTVVPWRRRWSKRSSLGTTSRAICSRHPSFGIATENREGSLPVFYLTGIFQKAVLKSASAG